MIFDFLHYSFTLSFFLAFMTNPKISSASRLSNFDQTGLLGWNYAPNTNNLMQINGNDTQSKFASSLSSAANKKRDNCNGETFCGGLCYSNVVCCNIVAGGKSVPYSHTMFELTNVYDFGKFCRFLSNLCDLWWT